MTTYRLYRLKNINGERVKVYYSEPIERQEYKSSTPYIPRSTIFTDDEKSENSSKAIGWNWEAIRND